METPPPIYPDVDIDKPHEVTQTKLYPMADFSLVNQTAPFPSAGSRAGEGSGLVHETRQT